MLRTAESIVYLGMDIGKASHAWTLLNGEGLLLEEGTVLNTNAALLKLAGRLAREGASLIVGCEATGTYYENAALAFQKSGATVHVINPALTSTKALRSSMRSTKTDKQDARGIAGKLFEKRGEIGTVFQWNPEERRLQAMARHLQFLKKQRVALRVRMEDVASRSFDPIEADVCLFDHEIERMEKALAQQTKLLWHEAVAILVAIRGVGEASACLLLAETGCMKRFPTSKAFAAFAGLDPTLKQSGTSVNGKSRMSKAGSPHLRARLTWSAKLLVRWNDTFKACFDNAISRGKAPGVAYGIVARKFATVVHQCVTNLQPFDSSRVGLGIAKPI